MSFPATEQAAQWRPGDPVHEGEGVSYAVEPVLSDCCPPGCWHHGLPVGGYAMRWNASVPVLQFLPWGGLHVTGCQSEFDLYDLAAWRSA